MLSCLFKREKIYQFKKMIEKDSQFGDEQETKIVKTKYNETVLLYHSKKIDYALQVRLYNGRRQGRIYINLIFEHNEMRISDIHVLDNNVSKGYGTVLLDYALDLAREKGANTVTGELHTIDADNRHRQNNFYGKYGFIIDDNKIKLTLN